MTRPILDKKHLPEAWKKSIDRDLLDRVVSSWTGTGPYEKGEAVLSRALKPEERLALELRVQELRNALAPASPANYEIMFDTVSAMLGAFPSMQRHSAESAAMIAEGYCHSVRGRPQWAVIEAARKVRENEAGLNPSYCPTEPEFAEQVRRLLHPFEARLYEIDAVIRGKPVQPVSQENRDKVDVLSKEHLAKSQSPLDLETEQRKHQRAAFVEKMLKGEHERRLREYVTAGLEPPEDKGYGIVSLPLMLEMGWRIETDPRGKKVLTAPPPPPPPKYSHADEGR